ncbi:N-acetyltransferase family protein [Bremerella sp. T1]|uniref:GNAT family N-acetyltransferase n=1 Tax=Bremerella sp. TYQ1 TaxID=3119568 RepID=UPI001CD03995|nr:GNAT family N-acetyltransferase [Bremerella volcania]UBM37087.1 GNAT family N-acetyltransferase [Bremerella volcania]
MIHVRPVNDTDAETLQSLYANFLLTSSWISTEDWQQADFAAISEGEKVFVATNPAGTVLGVIAVWEPDAFIHSLYVDPEYQGQGVGTCLLASLDAWLPRPWRLKCSIYNDQALTFYRHKGWRQLETGTSAQGPYFLLGYE